jgi:hypothetical protein
VFYIFQKAVAVVVAGSTTFTYIPAVVSLLLFASVLMIAYRQIT